MLLLPEYQLRVKVILNNDRALFTDMIFLNHIKLKNRCLQKNNGSFIIMPPRIEITFA